MIRYLAVEEIVAIHRRILEETGGRAGILDAGLLFAAVEKPKTTIGGHEVYPDIFIKAAILLEALVNYHAFSDGNKRTAYVSVKVFLTLNHFYLSTTTNAGFNFVLSVANGKQTQSIIATWLKMHSKRL